MSYFKRKIFILFFFCFSQTFGNPTGNSCKTPKNALGTCIILSSCKSLIGLLEQPIQPDNLRYLQRSTCDFSGDEPKVCCPSSDLPPTTTTPRTTTTTYRITTIKTTTTIKPTTELPISTTPTTTSSATSDLQKIVNHRNLHLLPNSSDCGVSFHSDRIAGGSNAGLGTYPWMALVGYSVQVKDVPIQFACGGTIINSKYVLTAAHCVSKLPDGFKPSVVRLGEYDQKSESDCEGNLCAPRVQDVNVEEIIFHEKYDLTGKKENDIAIIRLTSNIALGPFVSPICLPHGEKLQKISNSQKPIVAGWGRLTASNPDGAEILQEVSVPFVPMEKCNSVYRDILGREVDIGRFCAGGEKGRDSCQGDSGGPLMLALHAKSVNGQIRSFQFGIVSLGPKNCDTAGLPALYTKVSYFMPWILDHLRP